MKQRLFILLLCGAACATSAVAQTVYEGKGPAGKVYSDRPLPGGRAVELKPLTVIEPIPVPPASPAQSGQMAVRPAVQPAYRSFAIVFPEPDGSVAANTGTFEIRVAIEPPLQIASGHSFALRIDGRSVPGRYTATEMMVPPDFFGDSMPAGAQRHVVEASVIDLSGSTVISAQPVSFQTRFVNALQRPHVPQRPPPAAGGLPAAPKAPAYLPMQKLPAAGKSGEKEQKGVAWER